MKSAAVFGFAVLVAGSTAYAAINNLSYFEPKAVEKSDAPYSAKLPEYHGPMPWFPVDREETRILPHPNPYKLDLPCKLEVDCTPEQLAEIAERALIKTAN